MANKLKSYDRFERMVIYLLSISCQELGKTSVKTLEEEFGICRHWINGIFKRYCMVTPSKFIRQIKLIRAAALLDSPQNDTITTECIGQIIGIESPDYFRTLFKRFWGITPGFYRQCRILSGKNSMGQKNKSAIPPVKRISILNDTGLFGFNFVFIIESSHEHRLIVHDYKKGLLFDMKFKTHVDAMRGFLRIFSDTYTTEVTIPDWSDLIVPNKRWWAEKIGFIQSFPRKRTRRFKKFYEIKEEEYE